MILNRNDVREPFTYLFCSENGSMLSDDEMYRLFKIGLTALVSKPLQLSDYRQMAAHIMEHYKLDQSSQNDGQDDVGDLQMGHTSATAHAHYALGLNLMSQVGRGSAAEFYLVSQKWAKIFGYDENVELPVSEVIDANPIPRRYGITTVATTPNRNTFDANAAITSLRDVVGLETAKFRSESQVDALKAICGNEHAAISLPTGHGKTLVVLVAARMKGGILYIPLFKALYMEFISRATSAGLGICECSEWTASSASSHLYICSPICIL